MSKILPLLLLAAMVLHLVKPLNLPGLRRRAEVRTTPVLALGLIVITAGLSHGK